jgi:hypothetical protein
VLKSDAEKLLWLYLTTLDPVQPMWRKYLKGDAAVSVAKNLPSFQASDRPCSRLACIVPSDVKADTLCLCTCNAQKQSATSMLVKAQKILFLPTLLVLVSQYQFHVPSGIYCGHNSEGRFKY